MLPESVTAKIAHFAEQELTGTISVNFRRGQVQSFKAEEYHPVESEEKTKQVYTLICKSCQGIIRSTDSYTLIGGDAYCNFCPAKKK